MTSTKQKYINQLRYKLIIKFNLDHKSVNIKRNQKFREHSNSNLITAGNNLHLPKSYDSRYDIIATLCILKALRNGAKGVNQTPQEIKSSTLSSDSKLIKSIN